MGEDTAENIEVEATSIVGDTFPQSNGALHEVESSDQFCNGLNQVDPTSPADGSSNMDHQRDKNDDCKPHVADVKVLDDGGNGSGWSDTVQEGNGSGWGLDNKDTAVVHPSTASTSVTEQPWAAPKRRIFYLIKVPRVIDHKIKNEIKLAEMQLEETNKKRDFLRAALQLKRSGKADLLETLKPIREKEKACRDAIQGKRMELEPFLMALAQFKNVHSTVRGRGQDLCSSEEELNDKIANIQYRIQHESISLKEEKQLLREIKQLEATRNQVCANTVMHAELVESLGPREEIQDQYRVLCQELDSMRKQHKEIRTEYEFIDKDIEKFNAEIEELRPQFDKATGAQQEAYVTLRELRKQENAKNDMFYQNKRDSQAVRELVSQKNFEALEKFCLEQVEGVFSLWNADAKFRSEYCKANERSTVKRLETLDGRSLGPDEEPPLLSEIDAFPSPLPKSSNNRTAVGLQATAPSARIKSSNVHTAETKVPSDIAEVPSNKSSKEMDLGANLRISENTGKGHISPAMPSVLKSAGGSAKSIKEETQEDILENETQAAELKEKRRQEEMAKAKEAAERKKKRAERAESKALMRAKKEAERKEKEKEKKSRKKSAGGGMQANENALPLPGVEFPQESTKAAIPLKVVENSVNEIHKGQRGVPSAQWRKAQGKKSKTARFANTNPFLKKAMWPVPTWVLMVLTVLVLLLILVVFINI